MTIVKKTALKVHQLAKELGVNSKDIVARCQAEEIPGITAHLSPVSVGLAQTIREWFSGGAPAAADAADAPASSDGKSEHAARAPVPEAVAPPAVARKAAKKAVDAVSNGAAPSHPVPAHPAAGHSATTPTRESRETKPDGEASGGASLAEHVARDTHAAAPSPAAHGKPHAGHPVENSAAPRAADRTASQAETSLNAGADPEADADEPEIHDSKHQAKPHAKSAGSAEAPQRQAGAGGQSSQTASARTHAPEGPKADAPAARPGTRGNVPTPIPSAQHQRGSASTKPGSPSHRTQSAASASAGARERAAQTARPTDSPATPQRPTRRPDGGPQPGEGTARRGPQTAGDAATDMGGDGNVSFEPQAPPVMNIPKRPDIVKPVGPKLELPIKSAMAGPKVIRIEAPEQLPAPRPRSATSGAGGPMRVGRTGGSGTGGTTGGASGRTDDRRGGAAGRGGRRDDAGRSGRLARAGAAPGAPGEPWRPQDLREREDRLSRSEGFFKSHRRDSLKKSGPGGTRPGEEPENEPVRISEPITIKELSAATGVKAADILRKLFLSGTVATINASIDSERAMEIMMDFDIELIVVESKSAAEIIESRFADREKVDVRPRAPVVTILGHVDHGKTSLLDRIRNANVAAGEAGGITQATSAFQVPVKGGETTRLVTFIDTPGHEAFTNMRARGAKVTDIVVLVIAADDGVMPQTIESINHAKAAGVALVVALNKIDKPEATEANIRRILGQLAEHELNPVEWGGKTEVIRTSATKNEGVQDLLDILDYQADLLGLTADFGGTARGTVLEAKMEEGRGPVANVIVQEGTLKKGDFIVVGRGFGRVRDIVSGRGERGQVALPSSPVAISGIDQLPDAGDKFYVVESLKAAEQAAEERRRLDRERELAAPKITLDNIFQHLEKGQRKELSLVVKGDVQGSVETLRAVLVKISSDEVAVSVKHCAVGGINESDIALAEATNSIIVGFNVTSSSKARSLAEARGIEIRLYDVIYDLTDDVVKAASGLLAPELKLEVLGHAEVRQAFRISKVGMIAGCYVLDGTIERNAQIRVTRGGIVIEKDRRLEQLKRFKDDAKDVRAGQECGMKIVGYDDIKVGDVLECYKTISVSRSL